MARIARFRTRHFQPNQDDPCKTQLRPGQRDPDKRERRMGLLNSRTGSIPGQDHSIQGVAAWIFPHRTTRTSERSIVGSRTEKLNKRNSSAVARTFSRIAGPGSDRAISKAPANVEKMIKKARSLFAVRRPGMKGTIRSLNDCSCKTGDHVLVETMIPRKKRSRHIEALEQSLPRYQK